MLNFRNTSTPVDPRDLEQLIYDVAEYQRDADFQLLYKLMQNRVVYVPADSKSLPKDALPGARYVTTQKDPMRCYTVLGPQNQVLVVCATRHDAAIIEEWISRCYFSMATSTIRGANKAKGGNSADPYKTAADELKAYKGAVGA